MTVLANIAPADSLLINVDGYREGGPAGGGAHRMMVPNAPDSHGPYSSMYYHRWFDGVTKAQDYASGAVLRGQGRSSSQRVCFDNLYIFPLPGVPWFWNDWGRINECSLVAASPLYQSFNVYLRQRILDTSRSQGEVKGSANDGMSVLLLWCLFFLSWVWWWLYVLLRVSCLALICSCWSIFPVFNALVAMCTDTIRNGSDHAAESAHRPRSHRHRGATDQPCEGRCQDSDRTLHPQSTRDDCRVAEDTQRSCHRAGTWVIVAYCLFYCGSIDR